MLIYVGRNFTATKTGTAVREVKCEKCGCDFRYRLFRTGTGVGSAPYYIAQGAAKRRGEKAAAKQLQKLLLYGIDPVACPDCGWLQGEMVRELQKRAHRWALPTAIIVPIVLGLASFIFYMAASHDGKRPLDSSDTIVLTVLIAVAIASAVVPMLLRRMLLKGTNPNKNHPQRPDPIPGAPKPFRPGEEGVVDALPADAPADDGGGGGLTYQRTPPEVEPGGWVTVQMALWPIPRVCCGCLQDAEKVKQFTASGISGAGGQLKLPVRLCPRCTSRYRWRLAKWIVGFVLVGGITGYVLPLATQRRVHSETPIICAVAGAFGGLLIGALFASNLAPPVRFSRLNSKLNTIRVRFLNPDYLAIFMNEEPPSSPTHRSPQLEIPVPPPARPWRA